MIYQCLIADCGLTSGFPIIWILLKWAFEVANYRTGRMLGSFKSTFCGGFLMGVLGWGGVGGGVAANSRHAVRERPPVCIIDSIRWERGRRGQRCAAVMRTAVCWNRVTATLQHPTSHHRAVSVTLTLSFPLFLTVTYTKQWWQLNFLEIMEHSKPV